MNVKNMDYWNFLVEFLFIQNTRPQGLCISYFIKKFLPLKMMYFINSPLESINF
jgi:hypothetical protein